METIGIICLSLILVVVIPLCVAMIVTIINDIREKIREEKEAKRIAEIKKIEKEIYNKSLLGKCIICKDFLNSYTFRTEDGEIFDKSLFINEHGDIEIILSKGE